MTNGNVFCNRCGAQNSALAKFCANCGTPFTADSQNAAVVPGEAPLRPQGPAAPVYPSPEVTAPAVATRYGGFWIRLVAIVIDVIAVGIVTGPISAIIAVATGFAGHTVAMPDIGVQLVRLIITFAFSTLVNWIYEAALESSSYQATLGKMALGLKVTDLEGRRISFARATGRHFAKLLSGFILMIGFIMAGFTQRKQALHDMIAGTLVVRTM
jgi:uncharacterized RDD family membrane protein YckC